MGVDIFSIAKSGLSASKKALQTTSHNIANVNTEGFSKKTVSQSTATPIPEGNLVFGGGVNVNGVRRAHDEHIEKRLRDAYSGHEYFNGMSEKLSQVEQIFNEIDSEGLNKIINKFFNSFRDLANQPENETIRSIVREDAKLVIKDFNRIRSTLEDMNDQIGHNVKKHITEVNEYLHIISDLNVRINDLEAVHGETGDLRDQRDLAVKELSKFFKVHTYEDDKNQYVIQVRGLGSLVSGPEVQELRATGVPAHLSSNGIDGSTEIFFANRPGNPNTSSIREGRLKGMVDARNIHIKSLMDRMDEMAFHFANLVNAIHRRGFVNRPLEVNQEGQVQASDHKGPVTGIDLFEIPDFIEGASGQIRISKEVRSDLSNLATAMAPNRPGDNRIAIAISKLQHEKILGGGVQTIEEHFLESVGGIGLAAGKAEMDSEQTGGILAQMNAVKERMAGVSLDEEAANMIKFQHAYDASAKVLQTTDEMFQTILGIMG